MRFVEGDTLADAIRALHEGSSADAADSTDQGVKKSAKSVKSADRFSSVAFRRLLQSFIQVCETVAYAHSRGVIHRDLKPQNIMLGKFGETLVVDWGLAKVVGRTGEEQHDNPETTLRPVSDSSVEKTQMGSAVGTPAYMSPEQAAGRWDVIGAASDVYNLGAVLYAILTGRPPLEGDNWPELQQKIQRGDFPRPRTVKPTVPRALEAVCLRAMAMKPEERYPSARELASEIELWLADEPVGAYPEPVSDRMWRWARRRRESMAAYVASGLIAVVVLTASAWIVSIQWVEAESERHSSEVIKNVHASASRSWGVHNGRLYEVDDQAAAAFERLSALLGQGRQANNREYERVRREILQNTLEFWEGMIRIDEGRGTSRRRTEYYRLQQALCLAHMGEHQRAADEAQKLEEVASTQPSGQLPYDIARVYALCAAKTDNAEPAARYGDCAMKFLHKARDMGFFDVTNSRNSPARLDEKPDFAALRVRPDFAEFLIQIEARRK
jgi:serine/threonine protein kinase